MLGGLILGALETFFQAWLPAHWLPYQQAFVFVLVDRRSSAFGPNGIAGRLTEVTR